MSLTVSVPAPLRHLAEGRSAIELEGDPATVREALAALRATFPAAYERLVTERGELRPHINLFVETEDIRYTGGLDTPLAQGCRLFILPSVSGGRPAGGDP